MKKVFLGLLVLCAILCISCDPEQVTEDYHPHPVQMTLWTETHEYFSEFTFVESTNTMEVLTYVTDLANFQPVWIEGLELELLEEENATVQRIALVPSSTKGIASGKTSIIPGHYEVTFLVPGNRGILQIAGDTIHLGSHDEPHTDEGHSDDHEHAHDDEAQPGIEFLKERQWNQPFKTAKSRKESFFRSIKAYGQIRPKSGNDQIITAPVAGIVVAKSWPVVGTFVEEGTPILNIVPATNQDDSLATLEQMLHELESKYQLSAPRVAKLKDLFEAGSISGWEYEEARTRLSILGSELKTAKTNLSTAKALRQKHGFQEELVTIKAPFGGALVHVKVTPDQYVQAGTELVHLVKPNPVFLDLSISLKQKDSLNDPNLVGLYLRSSTQDEPAYFSKDYIRFLSTTPGTNPETGKLSSFFELNLEDDILPFGSVVHAEILIQDPEFGHRDARMVPITALIDDAGMDILYVQLEGESFERREVQVILRQGTKAFVEGLSFRDRVVVVGGNTLRRLEMVGSNTFSDHGHAH